MVAGTTAVSNHLTYDAFRNVVNETDASVTVIYGFTGREIDRESGLNYHRERYYDPQLKQWISEDPKGFEAHDTNLRRMMGNRAPNSVDPSGLQDPSYYNYQNSWQYQQYQLQMQEMMRRQNVQAEWQRRRQEQLEQEGESIFWRAWAIDRLTEGTWDELINMYESKGKTRADLHKRLKEVHDWGFNVVSDDPNWWGEYQIDGNSIILDDDYGITWGWGTRSAWSTAKGLYDALEDDRIQPPRDYGKSSYGSLTLTWQGQTVNVALRQVEADIKTLGREIRNELVLELVTAGGGKFLVSAIELADAANDARKLDKLVSSIDNVNDQRQLRRMISQLADDQYCFTSDTLVAT